MSSHKLLTLQFHVLFIMLIKVTRELMPKVDYLSSLRHRLIAFQEKIECPFSHAKFYSKTVPHLPQLLFTILNWSSSTDTATFNI